VPGKSEVQPRRMQFEACQERVRKTVSTVHIDIVEARSVLRFRKCQLHRIRLIFLAPNSRILAFVSKYDIDARIGGWIKPTYLEYEPDSPEDLSTPEEPQILT